MRAFCTIMGILLLAFGLCACGARENSAPSPDLQIPQETPEEKPVLLQPAFTPAPTLEDRMAAVENSFSFLFDINFDLYTILPMETAEEIAGQKDVWIAMARDIETNAKDAFHEACKIREEQSGETFACSPPDWKLIGALYFRFGTGMADLLSDYGAVHVEIGESGVDMQVDFSDINLLLQGVPEDNAFGPRLTYAYLNTIYDGSGKEVAYVHPELDEDYIKALHMPIANGTLRNSWYSGRDDGTRKHTGTDIRAEENTPILSCTSGIVQHIGSNYAAGNYIVILDDEGFAYHYYHMVRPSDFLEVNERVEAGDVVGHVGDTGNSAANHLHLSIMSPEYTYINPYLVLREMRRLQR